MENRIEIRNAKIEDLNNIVELEKTIWPEGTIADIKKFQSRLNIFQEGFFLAYKDNNLIGCSTSEIIPYNLGDSVDSWESITDNGLITNHNPNGNTLYIVSVGSISRSGGGSALINAQKGLTKRLELDYLLLGARIPGYDQYCIDNGDVPIEDYVKLKRSDGQLFDQELRFYIRNGLELYKVMPNYMENDSESRDYGAIMVWKNEKDSNNI